MIELYCSLKGDESNGTVVNVKEDEDTVIGRKLLKRTDTEVSRSHLIVRKISGRDSVTVNVNSNNGVTFVPYKAKTKEGRNYKKNDNFEMNIGDTLIIRAKSCYRILLRYSASAVSSLDGSATFGSYKESDDKIGVKNSPLEYSSTKILDEVKKEESTECAIKRRSTTMEFDGLFEYSQSLELLSENKDDDDDDDATPTKEDFQPPPKKTKKEPENKEEGDFNEQCRFVKEIFPGVSMDRIEQALKDAKSVDLVFTILSGDRFVTQADENDQKQGGQKQDPIVIEESEVKQEIDLTSAASVSPDCTDEEAISFILESLPFCSKERAKHALDVYTTPTAAINHIMDEENCKDDLSKKLEMLVEAFPFLPQEDVQDVSDSTTDFDEAFSKLYQMNEELRKKKEEERTTASASPLTHLSAAFPDKDLDYLKRVLDQSGGNVEEAGSRVLTGYDPDKHDAPTPVKFMAPVKSVFGRTNHYINAEKIAFDLDVKKPSQSLLSLNGRNVKETLLQNCSPMTKLDEKQIQWVISCFEEMLKREQEFHEDYVVFYHSYSYAHLLYEVQSVIATILLDAEDDAPPLPRVLFQPFDGIPTVDFLLEESSKSGHEADHATNYRNCAISVSNSLFAFSSEATPVTWFASGYSCTDLSFRKLLIGLLKSVDVKSACSVADRICEIATLNGLNNQMYQRSKSSSLRVARTPFDGNSGHMLQIFIKRSEVDSVAYDSLPYGKYSNRGPISSLLTKTTSSIGPGQARVFVHPELLLNPDRSHLLLLC